LKSPVDDRGRRERKKNVTRGQEGSGAKASPTAKLGKSKWGAIGGERCSSGMGHGEIWGMWAEHERRTEEFSAVQAGINKKKNLQTRERGTRGVKSQKDQGLPKK